MRYTRKLLVTVLAIYLVLCALPSCASRDGSGYGESAPSDSTASEVLSYPDSIGTAEDKLLTPILPEIVFSTTAEENGLDGTLYQIHGTVLEYILDDAGNPATLRVDTLDGEVVINDPFYGLLETSSNGELGSIDQDKLSSFFPMPEVGEFACIFAEYQGMSNKYNAPFFIYGSNEYLTNALLECIELI